jgi:pimeloyl-ACP methyl ester carboxylesterase
VAEPEKPKVILVALHDNGGSELHFARLLPHLPPTVRLHALALPGFAGRPANPCLRNLVDYASEISDRLASLPRPLALLGHGSGGSLALEFCQYHASEIQAVILHAPRGTQPQGQVSLPLMSRITANAKARNALTSHLLRPFARRMLFARPVPADVLEVFFANYRRCAVFDQMHRLVSPDWFLSLIPVNLPAILLWGERDRISPATQAEKFSRLLPKGKSHIQPGWSHYPMIEQPADYARVIADLVSQLVA